MQRAAVWGTEFIQFLAAQAILHQDDMKTRMNCTRMVWRKRLIAPGWYEEKDEFILFFKSSWCKRASAARNLINSLPGSIVPLNSSDDLCLIFFYCMYEVKPRICQPSLCCTHGDKGGREWIIKCWLGPWVSLWLSLSLHFQWTLN